MHIYNVASVTDKDKASTVRIGWTADGCKVVLLINDYPHAVFDFPRPSKATAARAFRHRAWAPGRSRDTRERGLREPVYVSRLRAGTTASKAASMMQAPPANVRGCSAAASSSHDEVLANTTSVSMTSAVVPAARRAAPYCNA